MRAILCVMAGALLTLAAVPGPAAAGIVDFAVGAHGGIHVPIDKGGSVGTVLGVKLRMLPPIPLVAVEASYGRVGQEDAEKMWGGGDVTLDLDGDAFDVFGVDLLIGGVGGGAGFKWYGIVGANFVEFSDGDSSEGYRTGGQAGVALAIVPPKLDLSVEARATVALFGWGADPDPALAMVTVGVYYFF